MWPAVLGYLLYCNVCFIVIFALLRWSETEPATSNISEGGLYGAPPFGIATCHMFNRHKWLASITVSEAERMSPRLGWGHVLVFSFAVCVTFLISCLHLKNNTRAVWGVIYLFFSGLTLVACGILVSWPGIEPVPSVVKIQSPNHGTTRQFPCEGFI